MLESIKDTHINAFDPTKVVNYAYAKNIATGSNEKRTIIDEREISPQMNIALWKEEGAANYTFRPNEYEVEGSTIKITKAYNSCAINLFPWIVLYQQKYGQFPVGNVNVTYYDYDSMEEEYFVSAETQGIAECTYIVHPGYYLNKTDAFKNVYNECELGRSFELGDLQNAERKAYGVSDMMLTSSRTTFSDGTTGYLVFTPRIESPTEESTFTPLLYYPIVYSDDYTTPDPTPKTYVWGYITESEYTLGNPINYNEWIASNKYFGEFYLVKDTEVATKTIIKNINFEKSANAPATISDMLTFNVYCYCEYGEGTGSIQGVKIISRHQGHPEFGTTTSGTTTTASNKTENFEFYFSYKQIQEGYADISMTYTKYDEIHEGTVTGTPTLHSIEKIDFTGHSWENIETDTIPGDDRNKVVPLYMYGDEKLRLPDLVS